MRTVILLAAYVVLGLAAVPLLLICTIFRWKRPIQAYSRFALGLGRRILGVRLELRGMENFDREKPYIFMSNHLSLLDGPILFLVIPRFVRVILKRSVFKFPIIGQAMRAVDFIPVDRKGRHSGKESIQKAARMIREKQVPFLIFPEGTRSRSGKLQRLRRGGFFLALESKTPIVPVSIKGTFSLLPPGTFFAKPGPVHVTFFPPIEVEGDSRKDLPQLISRVEEKIREGLKA
jgi:1-acyl-sn-glycerol-3-phosphate acyltransferase